ncbi:hypothetical protein RUM43_000079 [Polyplax serrata]|uniref:Nucleoside phosphorylase domain-containing protein n=1 Tax=Polyplax serrata TaxID=468196 RepID=A0AAN8SFC6_POLSC
MKSCIFVSCGGATEISPNAFSFETKEYSSGDSILQNIAAQLKVESMFNSSDKIWKYLDEGLLSVKVETEHDFNRPPPGSDKLYMAIGEHDLIEVTHPTAQESDTNRVMGRPRLHLGTIGAGQEVSRSDLYRQKFAKEHEVSAYVPEFDPVIESIIGNCRDSFLFVRGISDYKDGTRRTEWQPYAALAAAAVTKAIITVLDPICT